MPTFREVLDEWARFELDDALYVPLDVLDSITSPPGCEGEQEIGKGK